MTKDVTANKHYVAHPAWVMIRLLFFFRSRFFSKKKHGPRDKKRCVPLGKISIVVDRKTVSFSNSTEHCVHRLRRLETFEFEKKKRILTSRGSKLTHKLRAVRGHGVRALLGECMHAESAKRGDRCTLQAENRRSEPSPAKPSTVFGDALCGISCGGVVRSCAVSFAVFRARVFSWFLLSKATK